MVSVAEKYEISGVDLSTLMRIQRVDAQGHAPALLQADYLVPGRTGAVPVKPWFGPSVVMIGGIVEGSSRSVYLDRLHRLIRVCVNSGLPFTMRRTLPFPAGLRVATAQARYLTGLDFVEQLSPRIGRVMIEFSILSSFWSDEDYTASQPRSGSFGVQVPGDTATNDLLIRLSGGTNQRLTNVRTGDFVQFNASTVTHPVDINITRFTAVQNSVNVVDKIVTNPGNTTPYWFVLPPGPNEIVLTGGGTADVRWKGLYV